MFFANFDGLVFILLIIALIVSYFYGPLKKARGFLVSIMFIPFIWFLLSFTVKSRIIFLIIFSAAGFWTYRAFEATLKDRVSALRQTALIGLIYVVLFVYEALWLANNLDKFTAQSAGYPSLLTTQAPNPLFVLLLCALFIVLPALLMYKETLLEKRKSKK